MKKECPIQNQDMNTKQNEEALLIVFQEICNAAFISVGKIGEYGLWRGVYNLCCGLVC